MSHQVHVVKSNDKVSVPVDVSTFDVADAIDKQSDDALPSDDAGNHAATDNLTWSVVTRKNHRPVPHPQSSVSAAPPRQPQSLHSKKILGTQQPRDGSLKSGIQIVKKTVLHVDNLHQDCTVALLTDYLKANEIDVLSCYGVKSWMREKERDQVTAFRVCIPAAHRSSIFDSQLWSEGIIIRDWKFKKLGDGERSG